jgi:hypothetical protein
MMKVVTVATHNERYLDALVRSAEIHNVDLVLLGMGEQWKGWRWRLEKYCEFAKTLDPNELLIFTDAFDSLILRPLDDFEHAFNTFDSKIVIFGLRAQNFVKRLIFRRLWNTHDGLLVMGCFSAMRARDAVWFYRKLAKYMAMQTAGDDQVALKKLSLKYGSKIAIDTGTLCTVEPQHVTNQYIITAPLNGDLYEIVRDVTGLETQKMSMLRYLLHPKNRENMIQLLPEIVFVLVLIFRRTLRRHLMGFQKRITLRPIVK